MGYQFHWTLPSICPISLYNSFIAPYSTDLSFFQRYFLFMFEIVCLTICFVAFCLLCFSPPSSRLHQKVAMRQMIWRHWPADVSPFLVDDDVPVPKQLGYWFPGLPDFKIPAGAGCRGFVSRHRAPRDWHYTGCRCCWWSLVVADWCWWFEAIAISFYGGVIYEPARTMVYLERRLTIAPQQYLWVARVLDSFFMCWQYRFLTGWPKTNCVPFIKRIPKRTLNLAVFVLDVPVLLCLCVCACLFKVFSATMGCNPQVHEPKLMTWISIIDTLMTLQGWWCSGFTLVI